MTTPSDFSTLCSSTDTHMTQWLNTGTIIENSTYIVFNHCDPLEPKDHEEE